MTLAETVSTFIAFLALIVSAITAYRTLFARYRGEVYVKPRAALTCYSNIPCLVVGCEVSNVGAKSGAIDDLILIVKYRQQNTQSINTFSFLPLLVREDYSVFKSYQEADFEPFQSIPIPKDSRLTRHIVFSPSNTNFSPSSGEIELQLFSRSSDNPKWEKAKGQLRLPIDENSAKIWESSEGKSILLEATDNNRLRKELMEKVFS